MRFIIYSESPALSSGIVTIEPGCQVEVFLDFKGHSYRAQAFLNSDTDTFSVKSSNFVYCRVPYATQQCKVFKDEVLRVLLEPNWLEEFNQK